MSAFNTDVSFSTLKLLCHTKLEKYLVVYSISPSHLLFHIKSHHALLISLIKMLINLNCNTREFTTLKLFQDVVMPEIPY